MSATKKQPVTHDIGLRISWNNRPIVSVRPEIADARLGLPGKDVSWQTRRKSMQDVCLSCHQQGWVDGFYRQYDELIHLYNNKFAKPGKALYGAATPLLRPVKFAMSWLTLFEIAVPRLARRAERKLPWGFTAGRFPDAEAQEKKEPPNTPKTPRSPCGPVFSASSACSAVSPSGREWHASTAL